MPKSSAAVLDVLPVVAKAQEMRRRAAIMAVSGSTAEEWTPYPHQIAPPGDWDLWLLMAGRGAGKTDAAAHYTDQHMRGPACLPGIPGGHRAAIVAPTLGDATEACVNGPSGLKKHNPGVKLVSRLGGTFVVWPSGAEAKVFGAYTPDDVERLRAGGNRCFAWCVAAGVPVETMRGAIPIEQVRVGDRVATRRGWRRVTAAHCTGKGRAVMRITTYTGQLICTPDHRVWAEGRGWVHGETIQPGDTILAWQTSSTDPRLGWIGRVSAGTTTTDSGDTATATESLSPRPSGPTRMAPSPRGTTFTTSTASRPTTAPKTWSSSSDGHTESSMRGRTALAPECPAAEQALRRCGLSESRSSASAGIAAPSSRVERRTPRIALPPTVRPSVVTRVESDWGFSDVYDLTVEDAHEFFAGNVLVHNCEEFAAWRFMEACWDHLQFGLRIGPHPRAVASTTPKPKKLLKQLLGERGTVVTRATTDDNPNLPESYRRRLERYRGTRLGRQEIGGELLEDVPGALWTWAMLDDRRPMPDDLVRVVVAVDPSGGSDPENDEQGIGAAGLGADGRGYVLADRSCKLSPEGWGSRTVQCYVDFKADAVVGEANFGGDMVEAVVRNAAKAMEVWPVHYEKVTASRGKAVRAQPVAQLYEQGLISHCDVFPELEEELTSWTPESGRSPNRLDWLVWALTKLMVKEGQKAYVY